MKSLNTILGLQLLAGSLVALAISLGIQTVGFHREAVRGAAEGVGLAAPQVGVNYRMMVYNEAGEPGRGKEVVLVNPKITKFSKTKDLFEEGCLSFPKIYADVEVRYL